MVVGKITFASINANSRLQHKQQDRNIVFTGVPLKPDISKSLLNEAAQAGGKGVGTRENNLWRRAVKYMKNLFKKDKQAINGSETAKKLELGVPHKVTWTDFDSIEGELDQKCTKVIKNKYGEVVREFYKDKESKIVGSVADYDPKTGKRVKWTVFNDDGVGVSSVTDYDPKTRKKVKWTVFNKDGKTVSSVTDYDPKTGKRVKWTLFNKDGKTVSSVADYDLKTGDLLKRTDFNEDGTIKK